MKLILDTPSPGAQADAAGAPGAASAGPIYGSGRVATPLSLVRKNRLAPVREQRRLDRHIHERHPVIGGSRGGRRRRAAEHWSLRQ